MTNKTNYRVVSFASAVALAIASTLIATPAAHADGWARTLTCGMNYKCAMSSTTSAGVTYFLNGLQKANWATGGPHSWSGSVGAGTHTASMGSSGSFSAHNATCYCPSGGHCRALWLRGRGDE